MKLLDTASYYFDDANGANGIVNNGTLSIPSAAIPTSVQGRVVKIYISAMNVQVRNTVGANENQPYAILIQPVQQLLSKPFKHETATITSAAPIASSFTPNFPQFPISLFRRPSAETAPVTNLTTWFTLMNPQALGVCENLDASADIGLRFHYVDSTGGVYTTTAERISTINFQLDFYEERRLS